MADLTASSQDAEVPAPSMTVLGAGSLRVNEVTGGAQIRHDPCLWRKGHARTQRDGIHPRAEERGRGRSGTHWRLAPGLPAPEPRGVHVCCSGPRPGHGVLLRWPPETDAEPAHTVQGPLFFVKPAGCRWQSRLRNPFAASSGLVLAGPPAPSPARSTLTELVENA